MSVIDKYSIGKAASDAKFKLADKVHREIMQADLIGEALQSMENAEITPVRCGDLICAISQQNAARGIDAEKIRKVLKTIGKYYEEHYGIKYIDWNEEKP